ncbi:ABC transporter ATP-binding protein [Balneolaceae bacterium ANBcel3]|nr:ABC transporter ATP-binding protein [Balneolaceae bacterium ANBcel3]
MTEPRTLLNAEHIHKTYSGKAEPVQVLRGVNLILEENSYSVITGSSGSGKSTLLHVLGGLDRPDEGSVRFKGRLLTELNDEDLAAFRNKSIGFIFQFHHLLPEFTALENVFMPALIAGKRMKEIQERASYLLEEIGLKDRMDHRPAELSGGEQQRVAVARALMNEPELILADEPTGNLDEKNSENLIRILLELKEKEKTAIVLITHDQQIAETTRNRYRLVNGTLDSYTN